MYKKQTKKWLLQGHATHFAMFNAAVHFRVQARLQLGQGLVGGTNTNKVYKNKQNV